MSYQKIANGWLRSYLHQIWKYGWKTKRYAINLEFGTAGISSDWCCSYINVTLLATEVVVWLSQKVETKRTWCDATDSRHFSPQVCESRQFLLSTASKSYVKAVQLQNFHLQFVTSTVRSIMSQPAITYHLTVGLRRDGGQISTSQTPWLLISVQSKPILQLEICSVDWKNCSSEVIGCWRRIP